MSKTITAMFENVDVPCKLQQDTKARVIGLANLVEVCKRESGMCHRYRVSKVTANRCYVEYSNPDEYGTEHPMTAIFPCFWEGEECSIVLGCMIGFRNDTWDGEGWQAFHCITDGPELFRSQQGEWKTREEWEAFRAERRATAGVEA